MAAETRIKLTNIIAKLPEETVDSLYETVFKTYEKHLDGDKPCCPFCGGKAVVRNGHKCGKQEYRCKDCGKTFVSTTNTLMANSHQPCEVWEAVINATLSGDAIDFTAKRLELTHDLVFRMRQKFLIALAALLDEQCPVCRMLPKWMRPMFWSPIKERSFRNLSAVNPANMVQRQRKEGSLMNTSAFVPAYSAKDA